jgi:hypothetical protein
VSVPSWQAINPALDATPHSSGPHLDSTTQ